MSIGNFSPNALDLGLVEGLHEIGIEQRVDFIIGTGYLFLL